MRQQHQGQEHMTGKARFGKSGAYHSPRDIDPDLLPRRPRPQASGKPKGGRRRPDQRNLWRVHIKRVLHFHYGYSLPDDDAGRESLALLCHASFGGLKPEKIERGIMGTVQYWARWLAPPDLDALIEEVTARPRKLDKKKISAELNLTEDVWRRVEAWSLWPVKYPHADWKRDRREINRLRAARNRAAKRTEPTKKDQCADFLRNVFAAAAGQPVPAASIMRMAISLGLENAGAKCFGTSMRQAHASLGVERCKMGLRRGWSWRLPDGAKYSETPDIIEAVRPDARTPRFLEAVRFRSGTGRGSGRTLDEGVPASKGAASDKGRSFGDAPCLDHEDEGAASGAGRREAQRAGQDEGGPRSAPGLPPSATMPSVGQGFGRIDLDQPWAQPLRVFAASRQARDRGGLPSWPKATVWQEARP